MADTPVQAPDTVTISRTEYNTFRSGQDLLGKLYHSPKTHGQISAAIKEVAPDTQLPEPAAAVRVAPIEEEVTSLKQSLQELSKTLAEERKAERDRAADVAFEQQVNEEVRRRGFNEEGKKLMLQRMIDQKSGDVQGAAAYIMETNPRETPLPAAGLPRFANLYGVRGGSEDDSIKLLHTDPEAWQEQELQRIFSESQAKA